MEFLKFMKDVFSRLFHYAETILPNFISANKKSYSSNHFLLRLIENWKKSQDIKNFVGTVLMDLCKTFDCIPHDYLLQNFLHMFYQRMK